MRSNFVEFHLLLLAGAPLTHSFHLPQDSSHATGHANQVEARDVCATYDFVERFEDGYPRQTHKHVQLTVPMTCDDDNGCEVSSEESQTFEIGAQVGAGYKWADAGFSVAKSITTGQSNTCTAKMGETVCVWEAVGFTEYSVHKCEKNYCSTKKECETSYRIKSPNADNKGSKYYCSDACYDVGYQYWEAIGGGSACKRDKLSGRRLVC